MASKQQNRITFYYTKKSLKQLEELKLFLEMDDHINQLTKSATVSFLIDVCHQLFIDLNPKWSYTDRMAQLKAIKDSDLEELRKQLKQLNRQMDRQLYLELTNFHAITKGEQFDIQDLESIHSHFDPMQHELMARIDDVIKEDIARGQTIKHSHTGVTNDR